MRSTSSDPCRFSFTSRLGGICERVLSSSISCRCCGAQLSPKCPEDDHRVVQTWWRRSLPIGPASFFRRALLTGVGPANPLAGAVEYGFRNEAGSLAASRTCRVVLYSAVLLLAAEVEPQGRNRGRRELFAGGRAPQWRGEAACTRSPKIIRICELQLLQEARMCCSTGGRWPQEHHSPPWDAPPHHRGQSHQWQAHVHCGSSAVRRGWDAVGVDPLGFGSRGR